MLTGLLEEKAGEAFSGAESAVITRARHRAALEESAESLTRFLAADKHAHPELAFEERRTSDLVAAKLAGWGIEVHRGLAKTGVVGVIKGSRPGAVG